MAESLVQVSEGVGKKLHTYSRIIGANTVEDEAVVPGEYPLPSYFAEFENVSIATANDHIFQLMAAASVILRIRRITVWHETNATAAAVTRLTLLRVTTAGTGGTPVTPRPFDTGDAAASAAGMTLPTVKGTEGVTLMPAVLVLRQAVLTTASQAEYPYVWSQHPGTKPILIPAGTANGVVLKTLSARAGATVTGFIEYVETSFAG